MPVDEQQFFHDYQSLAKQLGINQNPDDPKHYYDYRGAYEKYGPSFGTGLDEASGEIHFPSEFKREGHPNLYVNGIDTRTGKPSLHPELQATWDHIKQAVQNPIRWADKAYTAYKEWGERNKERIPGLRAITEATAGIAETPGTELMLPIPMGLTSREATTNVVNALSRTYGRDTLNATKIGAIKDMFDRLVGTYAEDVIKPIKGPYPSGKVSHWGYNVDRTPVGVWKGDQFTQTGMINENPSLVFRPQRLADTLELNYGSKLPPKGVLRRHIMEGVEPMSEHQFGVAHDTGHWLMDMLGEDAYRKLFGFGPEVEVHATGRNIPSWFNDALTTDLQTLQRLSKEEGYTLPRVIDPDRPAYWRSGGYGLQGMDPYRSVGREAGSDLLGLYATGWPFEQIFTNTMPGKNILKPYLTPR